MDEKDWSLAVVEKYDLLANYPKSKRDTVSRANEKTDADRKIARRFDKEFFDGDKTWIWWF